MIDIRNYKVVHKNTVYHGLNMEPLFIVDVEDEKGNVVPATHLTVIAMNLHNGHVVQIYDKASEFGFVKVG